MIEKLKTIFTVILVVVIFSSIVYGVIVIILSAFETPDLVTNEEIALYTIQGNLVKEHSQYYYIQNCLENLVEGCRQEKYNEVYKLYLSDYKKQYTKEEVISKLKKFSSKNVQVVFKNAYVCDLSYIVEYEINGDLQYMLMDLNATKNSNYEFAFIK